MTHRRQRALAALALFALAVAGAIAIAVSAFPRGLFTLGFVALAVPLAWYGALREGVRRAASLAVAGVLLAAVVALLIFVGPLLGELAVVLALVLALVAARAAFTARVELPAAPRPKHAVVFWNPKAGGGKAEKAHLDEEARRRGIEPVKLALGDDLAALVARGGRGRRRRARGGGR